jgi:hypothetical protein
MNAYAVLILFFVSVSRAWPPTYGAEFEFTYKNTEWDADEMASPLALQIKERFFKAITEECLKIKCVIHELRGKYGFDYKITLPHGWWFVISHDPSVIEIKTKPSTMAELVHNKNNINHYIFEVARRAGFHVNHDDTAHFNFGVLSAFGEDLKLFLRFFVDYQNQTHLAIGSLGKDFENAPPLSVLKKEQRDALQKIVDEVETGQFQSLPVLSQAIIDRVYTHIYDPSFISSRTSLRHYQSIGLKYIVPGNMRRPFRDSIELDALLRFFKLDLSTPIDQPLELRAVWAQPNAETFIKVAELIEARIKYLSQQTGRIQYLASRRQQIKSMSELKTRFYVYVVESGLSYPRYNSLLPAQVRRTELAVFLREDLAIEKRLRSLNQYRDLLPLSEWFRSYAEKLIRSANMELQKKHQMYLYKIQFYRQQNESQPLNCARILF